MAFNLRNRGVPQAVGNFGHTPSQARMPVCAGLPK